MAGKFVQFPDFSEASKTQSANPKLRVFTEVF